MLCSKPPAFRVFLWGLWPGILLVSCFKGDVQPLQVRTTTPVVQPVTGMSATPAFLYRGVFTATSGISISGQAKISLDSGRHLLLLDSFSVSSGPDLKVYLAKEYPPANFVNLGALQRNSGTQLYPIPAGVDFSAYRYVLIHCQQYNHLFGYATLQ
ncbi:MAG: DM13 domain-containing protein [Bacteroidetes bacterium]|nr:DM13 domain-containing protein [Bacteroidota bacterium]